MTDYELALFVHIVAVVLWMGGGFVSFMFVRTAIDAPIEVAAAIVGRATGLGDRVFGPATFIALLSGLYMVWDGPWSFSDLWVVLGLAGIAIGIVLGAGFHSRIGTRALAHATAGEEAQLRPLLARWASIGRIDLVMITLVIAVMVFKPTI